MLTAAQLRSRTVKQLATMARRKGIAGWHSMRKEELVKALVKLSRTESNHRGRNSRSPAKKAATARRSGSKASKNDKRPRKSRARTVTVSSRAKKRLEEIKAKLAKAKNLAQNCNGKPHQRDRLVLMVRDPYWLQAYWELTPHSVERARVALGQNWHSAKAVLRLVELAPEGTSGAGRRIVRDIEIHGGVNNWYIDVHDPPKRFQVDIGYLAPSGKFLCLARSNAVTTPQACSDGWADRTWDDIARDVDRIYAMSGGNEPSASRSDLRDVLEERLRRPMAGPLIGRLGRGAQRFDSNEVDLPLEVDAELIVYGVTEPDARVTLRGEPIPVQPDGSFSVRYSLPERRQVLPVVASSRDGAEQRTVVLAVERNTKIMEPVIRDPGD